MYNPSTDTAVQARRKHMPVTYTNRKGVTYTLCQGVTRSGKPRYTFARDPKGKRVLEAIPAGWEISESVNGVVSLVRQRPQKLLPGEIAAVREALRRHPRARNYRLDVRPDRLEVCESQGPDAGDLLSELKRAGFPILGKEADLRAVLEPRARFEPVLRFILQDEEQRLYRAERRRYSGSGDNWIFLTTGPVEQLARRMIPTLGTDKFFELFF
jgi:hypothetical protein